MKGSTIATFACVCAGTAQGFVVQTPLIQTAHAVSRAARVPVAGARALQMSPQSEVFEKYGHLKGAKVTPVSETMTKFCQLYTKPILPQYRTLANELLQSTHLTIMDARYKYDAVFAFGLHAFYYRTMSGYPGETEKDEIFAGIVNALNLNLEQIVKDAVAMEEWAKASTEEEISAAAIGEGDSTLAQVAREVKDNKFYLYSRIWCMGLIQALELANTEVTEEKLVKLLNQIGFPSEKPKQDLEQYKDTIEKVESAEQLYREIEIREKKKMAERLEEKARRALAAAQAAENGEEAEEKTKTEAAPTL
ncbi:unnamed protein product [Chrysoparadoxa australica]